MCWTKLTIILRIGTRVSILKDRVWYDDPGSTHWPFWERNINHLVGAPLHRVSNIGHASVFLIHVLIIHFLDGKRSKTFTDR